MNIIGILLVLLVLTFASKVCGDEMELTPLSDEVIDFAAQQILKNTTDEDVEYYLVPIYDINNLVVKYWVIGYHGEGQIKNLEQLFASLWYPYDLWERIKKYFEKTEENRNKQFNGIITKEEYNRIQEQLEGQSAILGEEYMSYRNLDYSNYLKACIGTYYQIAPIQTCCDLGIPLFIEEYWACYYRIKSKYQTEDIEFVKFVYDNDCIINIMLRVGNDYIFTRCSGSELSRPAEIYEKENFVGFDLINPPPDCIFFRYNDTKLKNWDELGVKEYIESFEKYGNVDEHKIKSMLNIGNSMPYDEVYVLNEDDWPYPLSWLTDYPQHDDFKDEDDEKVGCGHAAASNVIIFFDAFWTLDYTFPWTSGPIYPWFVKNWSYSEDFQEWAYDWCGYGPYNPPEMIGTTTARDLMQSFWDSYTDIWCVFTKDNTPKIDDVEDSIITQRPVWIMIDQGLDDEWPYTEMAHSAYVIGYVEGIDRIIVFDFNVYDHSEQVYFQNHQYIPNYVDWDPRLQVVYIEPEPGIFCTLDYFMAVAGDYSVELGFSVRDYTEGLDGFQLYRSLNKSGTWTFIEQFDKNPYIPFYEIRYNDQPPNNEHYYYMLQEIGGVSWIFEINTDESSDDDDYITYCSNNDVEGGEDQQLPEGYDQFFPPYICSGLPDGPPRPDPPTNVSASDDPDDYGGKINLTWTPNTSPYVIEQKIYRSSANSPYYGSFQLIATLDDDADNYTDDSVQTYMQYYYVIRSLGQYESYDSRMVKAIATDERPYPPLNFSAQDKPNDQGGAVLITFGPPYGGEADVDYYVIYRKIPDSGLCSLIGTVDAVGSISYSFSDNNAPIGVDYEYWAKSVDFSQLVSYDSAHKIAHSVDNIAPSPPSDLTGYYDGQKIVLEWTLSPNDPYYSGPTQLPTDVQEYHIYRYTKPKPSLIQLVIVPAGTDNYSDASVLPGITYYYCIRAKDTSNLSEPSNVVAVNTSLVISSKFNEELSREEMTLEFADTGSTLKSPVSNLSGEYHTEYQQDVDCQLGDDFFSILESETVVYPNPASEVAYIEIPQIDSFASLNQPCTVHIYDLSGRLVFEASADFGTTISWNISSLSDSLLADGIYLVNIEYQNEQLCKPVLILR